METNRIMTDSRLAKLAWEERQAQLAQEEKEAELKVELALKEAALKDEFLKKSLVWFSSQLKAVTPHQNRFTY